MVKLTPSTKLRVNGELSRTIKKQIALILIFSFFLSLVPNFLYNERGEVFADEISCPPCKIINGKEVCCDKVYDEKLGTYVCINCPISCQWGMEEVTNLSCLPLEGTGEWTCGKEIPIGEVIDRTTLLAGRMLAEFGGIIENGREMTERADAILIDYQKWNCDGYTDWREQEIHCETGCYKYFYITGGERQPGEDPLCPLEATTVPKSISAKEECQADHTRCNSCADCEEEECCWKERYCLDPADQIIECPAYPKKTITCKYCRENGSCQEMCRIDPCRGCCWWEYFWPIIYGYSTIASFQEGLKNDINEKTPGGENLPENFKFKRSYILEQLDFARCELAQCWIPAEDYYDVLTGEKVGKHLLTCETATQMGLFDEDQIFCLIFQITDEWETVEDLWAEMGTQPWWQRPVIFFQILGRIIKLGGKIIWEMTKEWFNFGQEEGCYPTNYYCCQF